MTSALYLSNLLRSLLSNSLLSTSLFFFLILKYVAIWIYYWDSMQTQSFFLSPINPFTAFRRLFAGGLWIVINSSNCSLISFMDESWISTGVLHIFGRDEIVISPVAALWSERVVGAIQSEHVAENKCVLPEKGVGPSSISEQSAACWGAADQFSSLTFRKPTNHSNNLLTICLCRAVAYNSGPCR